jgi:hypothetical protein
MARRDAVFPSKYLKAADLSGKPITVTIERTDRDVENPEGKEQSRLSFISKAPKSAFRLTSRIGMPSSTLPARTTATAGRDTKALPTATMMAAALKDCIRIRPPAQRELPKQRQQDQNQRRRRRSGKLTLAEEMETKFRSIRGECHDKPNQP